MGGRGLLAAAFLLYALVPSAGHAQRRESPLIEPQEINVSAEEISYEQKTNTIVAHGNVVITRGSSELRADDVRLNRSTNEADAQGNVRLTDPEGTVVADSLHLNLDEETGFLTGAEIESRRFRYSLSGARVEKGLGQTYHIENGRFTTCRCADGAPSWSIRGRELDVTLEGYGRLAGGTFHVLDVPILYVPRAIFPVQRERQSGLLEPRFGASNRRGFQTFLPAYWAISKSQDATLGFDFETSARAGFVGEYRYALSRETRGFVDASYFNESFRGGAPGKPFEMVIPENRWSVTAEHQQPFLGASKLYGDVFLISDDLFLREINTYAFEHSHDVAIRTLPFTQTHVALLQQWERVALKGEGTYYQDLTGFQSQTLQRAPGIDLWGQTLLGQRLLGDFTASTVYFQRSDSVDGARFDLEPAIRLPLPLGRFAFGSVGAALHETAYHLSETRLADTGQQLRRDQSREMVQLGAEAGTSLSRTYPITWLGLEKVKHTIEPMAEYLYIPSTSQADLPFFDGVDRINHRNLLTYGVVSRFIGKFAGAPPFDDPGTSPDAAHAQIRELGRFSIAQSFDITRKIDPLQPGRAPEHFSDVDLDGRLNPSRALSLRFHTNYDTGNTNISAAQVGIFVQDPRRAPTGLDSPRLQTRTSVGISYRFLTQNLLQELDDNLVLRLADWAAFQYSSRYDVVTNQFLDNYFGLRLFSTCDCWALDFGVTDRTNPQEVEVRARLTLVGLGSSSKPADRQAAQ